MGEEVGGQHRSVYTWYRSVETEAKGAPRYFDHLDWDGDGTHEVLLDVIGADARWFAALGRQGDAWVRTYRDPCDPSTTAGG